MRPSYDDNSNTSPRDQRGFGPRGPRPSHGQKRDPRQPRKARDAPAPTLRRHNANPRWRPKPGSIGARALNA